MKKSFYSCLMLLMAMQLSASLNLPLETELSNLEEALSHRSEYEQMKRERIQNYQHEIAFSTQPLLLYQKLYDEYKTYNFDTAFTYVNYIDKELAIFTTPELRYEALLDRSFINLCGGLFKEAIDAMDQIEAEGLPIDARYYTTYARLLWDMAIYSGGEQSEAYRKQGVRYMQQAIELEQHDSISNMTNLGYIDLYLENHKRSIQYFLLALDAPDCSAHDSAIIYSTIAFEYRMLDEKELAFHYYTEAACCDIRNCTRETIALRHVARLLYEMGRIEEAERYIRIAHEDAQRYNARHRQLEISQILPIIEEHQLQQLRAEKRWHIILYSTIIVLLGIVIIVLIILFSRSQAIARARTTIAEMNDTLLLANHVKEQLVGNLLTGQAHYLNEVERYQQNVKRNAADHRFAELQVIPRQADAIRRRQIFFQQLDEMLLDIYPTFVEDFNALLRPSDRFVLKPGEKLNAEMRIFALIRMGIQQNDAIAQVMNYSVNTVYAYKTRTKNRSDLSNEAFIEAVMNIPSFRHPNP